MQIFTFSTLVNSIRSTVSDNVGLLSANYLSDGFSFWEGGTLITVYDVAKGIENLYTMASSLSMGGDSVKLYLLMTTNICIDEPLILFH